MSGRLPGEDYGYTQLHKVINILHEERIVSLKINLHTSLTVSRPIMACLFALGFLVLCSPAREARAQVIKEQRERGRSMLNEIKNEIKAHYYDPQFRGIDLSAHFKEAEAEIKNAVSSDQIFGIIAHALLTFEDSHTYFIPPPWGVDVNYGWEMQMIGDKCYVTYVEPGSDAALKGLQPGDEILSVFEVPVTRNNLHQIKYLFYELRPLDAMNVVVRIPGGKPRPVILRTVITQIFYGSLAAKQVHESFSAQLYLEKGDDLFIWKMPEFDLSEKGVDEMMRKVGQRKALILDLRGNGGGYEVTLLHLLGYFFDHDVKVGERRGRDAAKPVMAQTQGDKVFTGKLVVMVDSQSASAAELFARVVQIEKRGTVIGDRTAGAVTEARHFYHNYKQLKNTVSELQFKYGVSVTINEFIMSDGQRLERVGVTPDELVLPAPADLAARHDIALRRAAEIAGLPLDIEKDLPRSVPE